jgi:hypothetical protein
VVLLRNTVKLTIIDTYLKATNVVYKRAAYTSEQRTPLTLRTYTSAQLNHVVS